MQEARALASTPLSTPGFFQWMRVLVLTLITIALFAGLVNVRVQKPEVFSVLTSISMRLATTTGITGPVFSPTDVIQTDVAYQDAKPNTQVTLLFFRLSPEKNAVDGRVILSRQQVNLTNSSGSKVFFFPSFERQVGNYEAALQYKEDVLIVTDLKSNN